MACTVRVAAAVCCALIAAMPFGAAAARLPSSSSDGEAVVRVRSAVDARPVAGARIFLIGGSTATNDIGITDARGIARFRAVLEGAYRLVVRCPSYGQAVYTMQVDARRTTFVDLSLVPNLKVIASTRAHATFSQRFETLRAGDSAAVLSKSLLDAMAFLPGVSVQNDPYSGASNGISIDGKDPSLTGYAFNGVSIADPIASHAIDPDLLEGVQVDQARDTLNLLLLNPSESPAYGATATLGSDDLLDGKAQYSGTSGATGIALVATRRHVDSALNGLTYTDSSGQRYAHYGWLDGQSYYGVLRAPIGEDLVGTARFIAGSTLGQPLPAFYSGDVPYGYGAGLAQSSQGAVEAVADLSATLPSALAELSVSNLVDDYDERQLARVEGGIPAPFQGSGHGTDSLMSFDWSALDAHRTRLSVDVSSGRASVTVFPEALAAPPQQGRWQRVTLSRRYGTSAHFSYGIKLDGAHEDRGPVALGFAVEPRFRAARWRVAGRIESSAAASGLLGGGAFSQSSAATFDCANRQIIAQVPDAAGGVVRTTGVGVEVARSLFRGSIAVRAYDQSIDGVTLSQAYVPASSEPASFFPPNYLRDLEAGFATYGGCSGPPPSPSSIYTIQSVPGLDIVYRGALLQATVAPLPHVEVQSSYGIQGAVLASHDARISAVPSSIYIPGKQLPQVPLHRASLVVGWLLGDAKTRLVAAGLYTSLGNQRNLPSNWLWNAGIERRISRKVNVDIAIGNVTDAYSGLFTSPRYAVPIATIGGRPFYENAAPYLPPQLLVRFTTRSGI